MLKSIEQISSQPVVVLLYESGASGEFLGHAITSTVNEFTKTNAVWENNIRCKFDDYFGRTLTFGPITEDLLLPRINLFLESAKLPGSCHLALSHFRPHQLDFLKTHGDTWPVIEITTLNPISKRFQTLSKNSKIEEKYQQNISGKNPRLNFTAEDLGFRPKLHLPIEWSDIILTNTKSSYLKITEFLNCTGNADLFLHLVEDYKVRNQSLIKEAYES